MYEAFSVVFLLFLNDGSMSAMSTHVEFKTLYECNDNKRRVTNMYRERNMINLTNVSDVRVVCAKADSMV